MKCIKKRFSIGVSLNMSNEEFIKILDCYSPYIKDVYFSPPLGENYHTRKAIHENYMQDNAEERLYELLAYSLKKGLKIELALNGHGMKEENIVQALNYICNKIEVDSIVTFNKYADIIKSYYPTVKLIYSYNNKLRNYEDIRNINKLFDEVVIGNSGLRNESLFRKCKESGFNTRLLLNNGCSFNCLWCENSNLCKTIFNKNLITYTADQLYALQSIMPWEIHEHYRYSDSVDMYKISNRPCTYDYLDKCLSSYIYNINENYISESKNNYYLWARLGHFSSHYKNLKYDTIIEFKKYLWQKEKLNWKEEKII